MRTIGLTGGIGSGKSTVAQMLVARGAAFVNADLVGHRSYLKGTPTYERLIEAFGPEIVGADGEIDRQKLGRRVFADPEDRHRLNDIVWPAMAEMMARDLDRLRARGERVAVLEAAILLEAGWQWLVDEVWVVVAVPETAARRLEAAGMERDQRRGAHSQPARQRGAHLPGGCRRRERRHAVGAGGAGASAVGSAPGENRAARDLKQRVRLDRS